MREIKSEGEFRRFMEEIDRQLREEGVPITARPIRGWLRVARLYSVRPQNFPQRREPTPNRYIGEDLEIRVFDWFDEQYGDRLIVDFSTGHTIVSIRGDLFRVLLPYAVGQVKFIIDPETHGKDVHPKITKNLQVATVNVLECIDGLEPSLSRRLTQQELRDLHSHIHLFSLEFITIEHFLTQFKLYEVKSDLLTSIDRLMASPPHYGLSRWDSLQAAEKCLKAYLRQSGVKYPRSHDLRKLVGLAPDIGYGGIPTGLSDAVQCDPGVRYGEIDSTRDDALTAHRGAVLMCWKIAKTVTE